MQDKKEKIALIPKKEKTGRYSSIPYRCSAFYHCYGADAVSAL